MSKGAVLVSVSLIILLQISLQPRVSWLVLLSLSIGWVVGRMSINTAQIGFAFLAPLLPVGLATLFGSFDPTLHTVWIAGFFGCMLPGIRWSKWDLPSSWRVVLGGWALTLSLAWPVIVARELGFDLSEFFNHTSVNSWAFMSAPQVSGWVIHVVLAQLVGLLWLEWLICRVDAKQGSRLPNVIHGFWIGATISSFFAIYQGIVDLEFLNSLEWASRGRATGLMLEANGYGMLAALTGPLAVVAIRSLGLRFGTILATVVFAVNWTGLWMSGSRLALLCGFIGTLALAIDMLRNHRRLHTWLLCQVAVLLIVIVVLVSVLTTTTSPLKRIDEFQGSDTTEVVQTLLNRGGYGQIATKMIREYPLTGIGVGTYNWLAPDYWRVMVDDQLPFDNAQNWWRHQIAELGILGALPLLLWSVILMLSTIWGRSPVDRFGAMTIRGLLLGLGLVSLFGMPTQNPLVLLWFFSFVAILASGQNTIPVAGRLSWALQPSRVTWAVMGAIAVLYAGSHVLLAVGDLSVKERAVRANRDYLVGVYASEQNPDGGEFRWTSREARLRFIKDTPWMMVRVWVQHPDVAKRPVTVRLTTPCQFVTEWTLKDSSRVDAGLVIPESYGPLDISLQVSRTWRPVNYGNSDTRELGAALITEFVRDIEQFSDVPQVIPLEPCGNSKP